MMLSTVNSSDTLMRECRPEFLNYQGIEKHQSALGEMLPLLLDVAWTGGPIN